MNKFGLAKKVDIIKPSASLQVAQRALELKRQGKDIVSLSLGEPDFDVPNPVREGLLNAIENSKTHYTESQGVLDVRKELAAKIGFGVEADQIMFTSGCKFGIYLVLEAILDPEDEVILIEPAWVSYEHMITMCQGKTVSIKTKKENGFIPSIEDIKKAITSKTKAFIINNPNNPSGLLMPKDILDQIVEIAKENEMFIIADEIYSDIVYKPEDFYSMLNYDYERIIIASGFSKNFAMTGLRLGYIVAKKEITKAINKLHQHLGTCAPSIAQYSLLGNINKAYENDVPNMLKTYERRKNLLVEGLKDSLFPYIIPQATFYMLLDISKLNMKSVEASTYILEECGIATVPGAAFGESIDDFVRISFATSDELLIEAMNRLKKVTV
ncbi:MAG: pyridoxal phosphate-dependent aminotransferase [Halanaerobiales bacterium]|nr:pyridoxal phosphate-dependent aminotransferase [Halanaerobiales bacterium]